MRLTHRSFPGRVLVAVALVAAVLVIVFLVLKGRDDAGGPYGSATGVVMLMRQDDVFEPEDMARQGFYVAEDARDFATAIGDDTVAVIVTKNAVKDVPWSLLHDVFKNGIVVAGLDLSFQNLRSIVSGLSMPPAQPEAFGHAHQLGVIYTWTCEDGQGGGSTNYPIDTADDVPWMLGYTLGRVPC